MLNPVDYEEAQLVNLRAATTMTRCKAFMFASIGIAAICVAVAVL